MEGHVDVIESIVVQTIHTLTLGHPLRLKQIWILRRQALLVLFLGLIYRILLWLLSRVIASLVILRTLDDVQVLILLGFVFNIWVL